MIARSIATQAMLFGARSAQRSPFLRFLDARKARACAIIATRSLPVTATGPESRSSVSKIRSAAASRLAKIWLRKLISEIFASRVRSSLRDFTAILFFPALKRWAKLDRASGARFRRVCRYSDPDGSLQISHTRGARLPTSDRLLAVHSHQSSQTFIHRRQIIFPAPLAFPGWEVWITAPQLFFEIHAHARHQSEVPHHRPAGAISDFFAFSRKLLEGDQEFGLKVGIVDVHEQVFMTPVFHQIADSLIHRDSCRWHQRRHGSHNPMEP